MASIIGLIDLVGRKDAMEGALRDPGKERWKL